MAKKRVASESNFEKGEMGLASFTKLDETRARIDFEESGKSYNIAVSLGTEETNTVPPYFPFKAMKPNGSLKVRVTLNKENNKVLFVSPASGELKVKFVKFASPEGVPPVPEEKMGKGNKPYRCFGTILEVSEGRWKGCQLYSRLYANFGKDPEDGMLAVSGSGKGSDNLQDFLDATGVNYTSIPFSENPLPEIQEQALENARELSVMIVNGWIENFLSGLGDEAFAEAEEINPLLAD